MIGYVYTSFPCLGLLAVDRHDDECIWIIISLMIENDVKFKIRIRVTRA